VFSIFTHQNERFQIEATAAFLSDGSKTHSLELSLVEDNSKSFSNFTIKICDLSIKTNAFVLSLSPGPCLNFSKYGKLSFYTRTNGIHYTYNPQ